MPCPVCVNTLKTLIRKLDALQPALLLVARLLMSRVFFTSGLLKIHDWSNTIDLFTNEFPVPLLPPLVAAICGTTFELTCPVLLTLGLGARFATLPLLAMTAVINFTYQDSFEHYYWAALLGIILTFSAGKYSLDAIISRKCNQKGTL